MKITEITGSSPVDRKEIPDFIEEQKPRAGEVSFQRYAGTNVCQWHYRTEVYWHEFGPLFKIEEE